MIFPTLKLITLTAAWAVCAAVHAAEPAGRAHCLTTSAAGAAEPVGAGRALQIGTYSCRMEGGPFDGAVGSGTSVYEVTPGSGWEVLAGHSVLRGPAGLAVLQVTQATLKIEMREGRPAGFSMSGRGVVKLASGSGAAATGRTFSFVARSTGYGQFVVENVFD